MSSPGTLVESPSLELPVFDGDLSQWRSEVEVVKAGFRHDSYAYEAQLPQIIGYMPEDEQEIFRNNRLTGENSMYFSDDLWPLIPDMENPVPKTLEIVRDDIALLTGGLARLKYLELEKKFTAKDASPRGTTDFHVDVYSSSNDRDADLPFYVLSDFQPTQFYVGPAIHRGYHVHLDYEDSGALQSRTVSAPPFAIVRMSTATIHRTPLFEVDGIRTFARFSATRPIIKD